jgi:hypothetical protein
MFEKTVTSVTQNQEKSKFFLELYLGLKERHLTKDNFLTLGKIASLRYLALGKNKTRRQIIKYYEDKMYLPYKKRNHHKIAWYLSAYNFVKNCSDDVWSELVQKTEYDKQ